MSRAAIGTRDVPFVARYCKNIDRLGRRICRPRDKHPQVDGGKGTGAERDVSTPDDNGVVYDRCPGAMARPAGRGAPRPTDQARDGHCGKANGERARAEADSRSHDLYDAVSTQSVRSGPVCQGTLTRLGSGARMGPMTRSSAWDDWEQLRQSPDPDPIEVLRAISSFQKYFAAIEKEAVKVARSQNRTWREIGAALGRTRQAIWQRAGLRSDEESAARWEALGQQIETSWATSAEVRHKVGMPPP